MFNFLKKWFAKEEPAPKTAAPRPRPRPQKPNRQPAPQKPDMVKLDPTVSGTVVSNGPGKNVLVRNKYQEDDDVATDTLRILDDDELTEEGGGIDPYNTGNFDRSKNWDKRFRK